MSDKHLIEFRQRLYPAFSRRATQVCILSSALEKIAHGATEAPSIARAALAEANPFGWNERNTPPAPCPSYGLCTYPDCGHFLDVTSGVTVPASTEFAEAKRTIMEVLSEQDVRALAVAQFIQVQFHEKYGNAMQNANAAYRAEQAACGVTLPGGGQHGV